MTKHFAPIEKSTRVPLDKNSAFNLFTQGIDRWWPVKSHSLSGEDATVEVEPREGGKIFETTPDGDTHDWATITTWEPGDRLAFDWYVGRDPAEATQVEVTFTPEGDGTRVDLTHQGFEALGTEATAQHKGYRTGWDHVFYDCFGGACTKAAA